MKAAQVQRLKPLHEEPRFQAPVSTGSLSPYVEVAQHLLGLGIPSTAPDFNGEAVCKLGPQIESAPGFKVSTCFNLMKTYTLST